MQHPGTVTSVKKGFVTVQITTLSACAACQAHSKCGFAESKTKTLDIPTALWQQYNVGEPVTVTFDHSRGLAATWWAYLLPAILLIAAVVAFSFAGFSEPIVILFSLLTLALYILLLYILRKKLDSRFTLTITHNS